MIADQWLPKLWVVVDGGRGGGRCRKPWGVMDVFINLDCGNEFKGVTYVKTH